MAHELNFENGEASMMYVGDVPWHGLGTRLEAAPQTAEAAIIAAHLDWQVGLMPIFAGGKGRYYNIPGRQAVVRLDKWGDEDCPIYGLVGPEYTPLQNRDAFSFFDPLVESGGLTYETAGSLGKGERVWVLAKVNGPKGPMMIKGKDMVDKYLLLSNGHDGRTAVQVRFTPVRVVCQNTLSWALAGNHDMFKVYHDPRLHRRLDDAQESVKAVLGHYENIEKRFQEFAAFEMTKDRLNLYVGGVFPDPTRKKGQSERSFEEAKAKSLGFRNESARLFEEGKGNSESGIRGSLWAAYNGITELVDHHWTYKSPWQRMNSICFGEGERLKHRAFDQATVILTAN
jgi:phage/plasmid-like protein (TIGR03299 family)